MHKKSSQLAITTTMFFYPEEFSLPILGQFCAHINAIVFKGDKATPTSPCLGKR